MKRPGFTLIEALIGMALSLLIMTAGLEFFILAEKSFLRLKAREEAGQSALAALDRIRIDLLHAGAGLAAETRLGLVAPVETAGEELRTASLERPLLLAADAQPGDTRLALVSSTGLAAGRRIVLRLKATGEVRTVARVEPGAVLIDAPLGRGYARSGSALSLLELVAYFRDGATGVLRRRANASPAQPLLENTAAAAWTFEEAGPLVRVRLELDIQGAHPHEATIFIKNLALARSGT
jgi:type II secretory pathway pseudopilin PulG